MRTQEQRDMQTLDIASVFLVHALMWFAPLAVLATVAGHYGVLAEVVRVAFPVAFVAYAVTVAVRLRRRSRRSTISTNVSGHHN